MIYFFVAYINKKTDKVKRINCSADVLFWGLNKSRSLVYKCNYSIFYFIQK